MSVDSDFVLEMDRKLRVLDSLRRASEMITAAAVRLAEAAKKLQPDK